MSDVHGPVRCCMPGSGGAPTEPATLLLPRRRAPATTAAEGMVLLPGGEFLMGTQDPEGFPGDGEGPVRRVRIAPFRIDACAVSNDLFAEFATATGYRTDAERIGWSYVFAGFLTAALRRGAPRPERTPWWCGVQSAAWDRPEGPGSTLEGRGGFRCAL